tara:strand:- start:134 stop:589 length:456 start_codon:yes stop_codon:yes gene_type:complete
MSLRKVHKRKENSFSLHKVDYTDTYTQKMDEEGLKVLKWSMFDSPDKLGSGKYFMESEPVFILDEVFRKERLSGFIMQGYVSKDYADKIAIPSNSGHRVGKSIKFRCINSVKRFSLVKGLIQYGIDRIQVSNEWIYFDTDNYLKKPLFICF